MQKSEIIPGQEYALREPPKAGEPLQHVRAIEHVRGSQWRVQWVEPNEGLIDYVPSVNIIVPWRQHRAFLRDEERWASLARISEGEFPGPSSPVAEAVDFVLDVRRSGHRHGQAWSAALRRSRGTAAIDRPSGP